MKTQEQKLQHVMEAAGECWHEDGKIIGDSVHIPMSCNCSKCDVTMFIEGTSLHISNPSPDDLNELFRLADKLNLVYHFKRLPEGTFYSYVGNLETKKSTWNENVTYTKAQSFLNALFIATGGKDA